MSNRFYPRFVKGNPQLRIFLPNFKMILIRPKQEMPKNVATFKVDPQMTNWDIKNYLEKIYNVTVCAVRSEIYPGKLAFGQKDILLTKQPDYKIAHVSLPPETKFEWPDLYSESKEDDEEDLKLVQEEVAKFRPVPSAKPTWFN